MRYPGGKGKTYQHVINLMPPHRVYIETHLGGGAVLRNKRPAALSIGIDIDDRVLARWSERQSQNVHLLCERAETFLQSYEFKGDELVYLDPPYYPSTRRQERVYRHDYSEQDHMRLLELICSLPCMVMLSGYANPAYAAALSNWRSSTFLSKTHVDVRTETLWFNFDPPAVLHDPRYLGGGFREREATKRRGQRLQEKVHRMDPRERAAFSQWLHETYPLPQREQAP
jgi:DNA adenine methylase